MFYGGEANDKANWDKNALYFQLKGTDKCIAVSGYNSTPSKIVTSKDEHSSEVKEYTTQAKNCQETFHWRLKSFNILGHIFRHGVITEDRIKLHKMAVELVADIV